MRCLISSMLFLSVVSDTGLSELRMPYDLSETCLGDLTHILE